MLFSPNSFWEDSAQSQSLQTLPPRPWLNLSLKAMLELWSHSFIMFHELNFVLEIFQPLGDIDRFPFHSNGIEFKHLLVFQNASPDKSERKQVFHPLMNETPT